MSERPERFSHASFQGLIGVAHRDITPPVGIYARNWGAAKHDACEGIHRPLSVTAMTLRENEDAPPLALLAIDLIGDGDHRNPLVNAVIDSLGIDSSRVMMAFGHTHAGPAQQAWGDLEGMDLVPAYASSVVNAVAEAATEALNDSAPGTLSWHYGACQLATNRDLQDPDAERLITGFNPRHQADDTVLVGRVTGDDGAVRATLVNYACHPTTFAWDNKLISPDWVGAMREVVETQTGGAPCLFLQGASGELSPREQYTADPQIVDRNGRQLGFAVLATLEDMLPPNTVLDYDRVVESGAPLGTWKRADQEPSRALAAEECTVDLKLKPDIPTIEELKSRMEREADRALRERLRRKLALRSRLGNGDTFGSPVWLWRVGDAILVGLGNEAYSDFQMELRKAFPGRHLAVMNLVNGSMGYLAPQSLYDSDLYQVWQSPFDRGGLENLIESCRKAIAAEG